MTNDNERPIWNAHTSCVYENQAAWWSIETLRHLAYGHSEEYAPPLESVALTVAEAIGKLSQPGGLFDPGRVSKEEDIAVSVLGAALRALTGDPKYGVGTVHLDTAFMLGLALGKWDEGMSIEGLLRDQQLPIAIIEHVRARNENRRLSTARTKGWWKKEVLLIALKRREEFPGEAMSHLADFARTELERKIPKDHRPVEAVGNKRDYPSSLAVGRYLKSQFSAVNA